MSDVRNLSGDVEIGDRLRLFRRQHNISQHEMAEALDFHQSNLSSIETGRTGMTTQVLRRLTKKYSISLDWLIDNFGDQKRGIEMDQVAEPEAPYKRAMEGKGEAKDRQAAYISHLEQKVAFLESELKRNFLE
jgi:transcriptional regulator with XRE-family HTH domain